MEAVSGVFHSRADATNTINELRKTGIPDNRLGLITPGSDGDELEAGLPVTDTESPGMGRAMGAAVGGAMGAAGGATLGLAMALLGAAGATAGAAVGDTIEEELGEGVPHEDIYLFEDSLRHGRSIVIAYAETDDQADKAEEIFRRSKAFDLDDLRARWWEELRDGERSHYHVEGSRDFDRDEESYRRGFEAALHTKRRGKAYSEVEDELRTANEGAELDSAFRAGYERGLAHQSKILEARNT
jgi:hypothetical protein